MKLRQFSISEYKSIGAGFKLVALTFRGNKFTCSGAFHALKKICLSLIHEKKLGRIEVHRMGLGWIGLKPDIITCPILLEDGIYLSEQGTETTLLLRISVLLKRLRIPQDDCVVECSETADDAPAVESVSKEYELKEWDESADEPLGSIGKRLHEFTNEDYLELVPYKVGIGRRRYAVESWADCANTLIAYLCQFFGTSGYSRLYNVQSSGRWHHCRIIAPGDNRPHVIPLGSDIDAAETVRLMSDLIRGVGFDRYSFAVTCAPRGSNLDAYVHEYTSSDDEVPYTPHESPENVRLPAEPGTSMNSAPERAAHSIKVVQRRHLRPDFTIERESR